LPADPAFESECMSALSDPAKFYWQFKSSILTRSGEWGLIWRVDFETPGAPARDGFVNHVTCWRPIQHSGNDLGTSVAVGQRVSPLGER
jgi:hypothetical protein